VSIRRVKVMRSVVPHEEQDGGVQTCQHITLDCRFLKFFNISPDPRFCS
jgi:hypothetical protein